MRGLRDGSWLGSFTRRRGDAEKEEEDHRGVVGLDRVFVSPRPQRLRVSSPIICKPREVSWLGIVHAETRRRGQRGREETEVLPVSRESSFLRALRASA